MPRYRCTTSQVISLTVHLLGMNRTWTEQTILEWKERRNTVRKAKDLPSLDALYTSARIQDTQLYAEALQAEKSNTVERLERYYTKTVAWEVRAMLSTLATQPYIVAMSG